MVETWSDDGSVLSNCTVRTYNEDLITSRELLVDARQKAEDLEKEIEIVNAKPKTGQLELRAPA